MNAHDPNADGAASLHYGDGDFVVLRPGTHVVCAVSGRRIPLEALRYWNVARQEAYAGPLEATHALAGRGPSPLPEPS